MFKPIDKKAMISYVSVLDPAIDKDASDIEKAASECLKNPSAWASALKFKAGEQPTKFVIGVIPSEQIHRIRAEYVDQVNGKVDFDSLRWAAFLACVRDIEGWQSAPPKVGEYVDPQWLRDNFVRSLRAVALEVGMVAWSWNMTNDDDVKN